MRDAPSFVWIARAVKFRGEQKGRTGYRDSRVFGALRRVAPAGVATDGDRRPNAKQAPEEANWSRILVSPP